MNMTVDDARQRTGTAAAKPKRTIHQLLDDPKVKAGMSAVAGKYLHPEKMLRLAINAVTKTPKLALCDNQSLLGAFMSCQALQLEPNTIKGHAFLIPYDNRRMIDGRWTTVTECQMQLGYKGLVTLYRRIPEIAVVDAQAIHEGDHFQHMQGSKAFLEYRKSLQDRGELVGSYCFTQSRENMEQATVLTLEEIYRLRSRSPTYTYLEKQVQKATSEKDLAKAKAKLADTPWVLWEDVMALKSAIKQHARLMSSDSEIQSVSLASDIDNLSESGLIDLSAMNEPDQVRAALADGEVPTGAITDQNTDEQETDEETPPEGEEQKKAAPPESGSLDLE